MLFLCGGGKISAGYRNHGKVRVKHMTQIDKNIAFNLKRIRKSKNMSLDMLAERTGVSKSMLGQIERGESNPTVSTIGKIVEGLKVPFEQLIYNRKEIMVVPSPEEAPVCKAKEGEYRIYVMLPYDAGRNFEIYQGELTRNARMESESHGEQGGTQHDHYHAALEKTPPLDGILAIFCPDIIQCGIQLLLFLGTGSRKIKQAELNRFVFRHQLGSADPQKPYGSGIP